MIKQIVNKLFEKSIKNRKKCLQTVNNINRILLKDIDLNLDDNKLINTKKVKKGNKVFKQGQLKFQPNEPVDKDNPLGNLRTGDEGYFLIQLQKTRIDKFSADKLEWVTVKEFPNSYSFEKINEELEEMLNTLNLIRNSTRYK